MKCANCGALLAPSDKICGRCKVAVSHEFNYTNMEKELLHTVWEEETINHISGGSMLYAQDRPQTVTKTDDQKGMSTISKQDYEETDDRDEYEQEPKKQPGKLVAALVAGAAAFAGIAFFAQSFSTEYVYGKTEAEYQNCLKMLTKEDYPGALSSAELLLKGEPDSLAYLALKNTICEKTGDSKAQKETLKQIIKLDADNYQAYEKLLELYLLEENQKGIEKLAADAPNSAIAAMLDEYLVDTPYLELTPGVYDASQTLVITSEGKNSIFYTLDGSSPQETGVAYTGPITLEQDYIYSVRAVCKNERGAYGEEASGEYQIGINAVTPAGPAMSGEQGITDGSAAGVTDGSTARPGQPEVYPQSGTYTTQQRITIDVPIGYQAYYSWTQGTTLTSENGTLYTGGITMPEGDSVLSVIVTDGNGNSSEVKQINYSYRAQ